MRAFVRKVLFIYFQFIASMVFIFDFPVDFRLSNYVLFSFGLFHGWKCIQLTLRHQDKRNGYTKVQKSVDDYMG